MSAIGSKTYAELVALVETTFGCLPDVMVVRYHDDEGDLVDISTDQELLDAFSLMESEGRTLKLLIEDKHKNSKHKSPKSGIFHGACSSKESLATGKKSTRACSSANMCSSSANACSSAKCGGSSFNVEAEPDHPHGDAQTERKKRRCHKNKGKEKEEQLKKEVAESFREFLSDKKVVMAIQDAVPDIVDNMLAGKGLLSTLEHMIDTQSVLKEHPFVQKAMPHLRSFLSIFPSQVCLGGLFLELMPKLDVLFNGPKSLHGLQLFRKIIGAVRSTGKEYFKGCCPIERQKAAERKAAKAAAQAAACAARAQPSNPSSHQASSSNNNPCTYPPHPAQYQNQSNSSYSQNQQHNISNRSVPAPRDRPHTVPPRCASNPCGSYFPNPFNFFPRGPPNHRPEHYYPPLNHHHRGGWVPPHQRYYHHQPNPRYNGAPPTDKLSSLPPTDKLSSLHLNSLPPTDNRSSLPPTDNLNGPFKFASQLETLKRIGYKDEAMLKYNLEAANGDINLVLSWLCPGRS